ncbi:MAG TPA: DNA-directed RNA polymerase subunit beta' [Clostridiales bacterium]|nr:MAG: DNA-directed RNA polymerase subunit beta' [Clostridiales bacterium GWD2_32_19]HCC07508.1 DNA-directed RNA polymerase subunit beta' [Clostridiales bacterium]
MSNATRKYSSSFDIMKIKLASPEKIREWSKGEIKKPETINYRTLKPERDGLFCERIFGPTKDWECFCGKYKRVRYKGVVCDRCGVEVTKSKVRRERMGHIELAAPVSHIWYFKGIPSRMGLLLDLTPRALEKILYFASYIVVDQGNTRLDYKQLLSENEYREAIEAYGEKAFRVSMGAEAIKELLQNIDLQKEFDELRTGLRTSSGQKKLRIIKRLEAVEAFLESKNKPEWMIMDVVPVIPPELRPMVQLDGGRFATSDLNDLYRRVINRNNRLKRLLELGAPDIIVRNEKRMLQEAVDGLIDNGRRGRPVTGPGNRPLKSLSDMLKGKQGRFRQNLLGKRVDYSGRSVIVVGPELKFYQCGLPKEMAIELFKPFVMRELVKKGVAHNIKSAKKMVERLHPEVWEILENVIKEHPVLLNRAPTLHRLGIQAFEPILVEGKAIRLHPLVCTAFNADFDGDQMPVHVPLSAEAQAECRFLMLSSNNLLKLSDGAPVVVPTQDMILGVYYMTLDKKEEKGEGRYFKNEDEVLMAYFNHEISIHSRINVRRTIIVNGIEKTGLIDTTPGKIVINTAIPQDIGYIDRTKEENMFKYEIDFLVDKKQLIKIIDKAIQTHDSIEVVEMLDEIKNLGFKYSTQGALTVAISDMLVPPSKYELLAEAEIKIEKINSLYRKGLMTDKEKHNQVISIWDQTTNKVTDALMDHLGEFNNISMMANSGARGSRSQIKQLAGMRGNMADTSGEVIELPIKSSFKEGLNVLEYFISAHGARKGMADTALRTADSGYLTRRLVDVSQDLITRDDDCFVNSEVKGIWIKAFKDGNEVIESLENRINGRWSILDVVNPSTGEIIVPADTMITKKIANEIVKAGIDKVNIRTVFTCESNNGVCAKCYGSDMSSGKPVKRGEAIGIIAAQSIGEPGTQLTMRTFHSGGIAGKDITQGLPRVEEIFEARRPKGMAIISEIDGIATLKETNKRREIIVQNDKTGAVKTYLIPYDSKIKVYDDQEITAGERLTDGSINPHDILEINGLEAVQQYILKEVQKVYSLQGVDINDKHVEIITRQMLRKVKIDDPGDSNYLPGKFIDRIDAMNQSEELLAQGLQPIIFNNVLLGITKASLATDSFLSAASFQETTRVLTEAAIKGKMDNLVGLKENVILGKLIPAGTGMEDYEGICVNKAEEEVEEIDENSMNRYVTNNY